jgi:hypothetical protein
MCSLSQAEKTMSPDDVLNATTRKLIHDCDVQAREDINAILSGIVLKYVLKAVEPVMSAVLDPLASLVPAPLEALLDVKALGNEVVVGVVKGAVTTSMEPGCSTYLNRLHKLTTKLAV